MSENTLDTYTVAASLGRGREVSDEELYYFVQGNLAVFSEERRQDLEAIFQREPWRSELLKEREDLTWTVAHTAKHPTAIDDATWERLVAESEVVEGTNEPRYAGIWRSLRQIARFDLPGALKTAPSMGNRSKRFSKRFPIEKDFFLELSGREGALGMWTVQTRVVAPSTSMEDAPAETFRVKVAREPEAETIHLEAKSGERASIEVRLKPDLEQWQVWFAWGSDGTHE